MPIGALVWGAAAVLVSHRWLLWLHPLDWVGVPLPLSMPLCLLLWLLCGLLGGLLVASWAWLVRRLDPARPGTALLAAALWGLAEVALARGPLFWIGLGSAPLPGDPALAGLARLGGVGLVAAAQLLVGWCLWWTTAARGAGRSPPIAAGLALLVSLVLALHLVGLQQLHAASDRIGASNAEEVQLLVLQPAIPTRRKFAPDQQRLLLNRLATAQRLAEAQRFAASGDSTSPVLVLPEGALALGQGVPLAVPVEVLAGGFRLEGDSLRSSLLRLAPASGDGTPQAVSGWVDKHRLVPLGEAVPFGGLLRWSGLSAVGGVEPGMPSRVLQRPEGPIGIALCYEIADGVALADAARSGAGWLLASANLDPYPASLHHQFTTLARLRALETGRWLVSAANTGPSLVVDPAARIQPGSPPAFAPATASLQLRPSLEPTPYLRLGERPLLLLLAAGAALRLAERWKRHLTASAVRM
ncbi:MAG: nitrilase-related carbon-nitrogen hydrolase [Cyanobacteriota bacterium]|nr:nitrilase-related carbon-nitrogen hydrolase [Cyanobacteriota bacterium]